MKLNKPESSSSDPQPRSFLGFAFFAWQELFRPKDQVLRGFYLKAAAESNLEVASDADLETLRSQVKSEFELNSEQEWPQREMEKSLVRLHRVVSSWNVFWSSVLPTVIAIVYFVTRLNRAWESDPRSLVRLSIASVFIALVSSIAGLFVQGIFLKPFGAFVNRFFGMKENGG